MNPSQLEEAALILHGNDVSRLMALLDEEHEIIGPIRKGRQVLFGRVAQAGEPDYPVGSPMNAPKQFLHPPMETLFSYRAKEVFLQEERKPTQRLALFAVHSCDVHALLVLDRVFGQDYPDPRYWARRERTFIVGLHCTEVGENCFCASMGTGPELKIGYDLLLTHLGDRYLLEIGSEAGGRIAGRLRVNRHGQPKLAAPQHENRFLEDPDIFTVKPAEKEDLEEKARQLQAAREQMGKQIDLLDLQEDLARGLNHPYWKEVTEECLGCGNCALVSPTCYCYNVVDRVSVTLEQVERSRHWDVCLLMEYAAVHGTNFRKPREARLKQFIYHKLSYWKDQYGVYGCVGCGRCITWCPAGIDITQVVRKVREEKRSSQGSVPVGPSMPTSPRDAALSTDKGEEEGRTSYEPGSAVMGSPAFKARTPKRPDELEPHPLLPREAVVLSLKPQTYDTTTYTLALKEGSFSFRPGQFNMVSLLGIGEAPISLSSEPWRAGSFDHTVRAVGNVTHALARIREGDRLHLRGPYGRGWPMEEARGKDILLVAGGIGLAPLRPLIVQVAAMPEDFGRVEVLYGARTPDDLLFVDEIKGWEEQGLRMHLSVDRVPSGKDWAHNVGVVITLFDQVRLDPQRALALVCGPEVMMKFVVLDLLRGGYTPERIYLSLERRMECGVALCGHCQLGPHYVCRHGPVFPYAEIRGLFGRIS